MEAVHEIEFSIFLIFTGAAVLATLALYARQAMIVAYIILGVILGPWGLGLVDDPELIADISLSASFFCSTCSAWTCFPRNCGKCWARPCGSRC